MLAIGRELVRDGSTYLFAPGTGDEELRRYWFNPEGQSFVAVLGGEVAGVSLLKPNHGGRGSHVANASFAVAERFQGRGVGRALGQHALEEARRSGFRAMQFNFVVATNPALELWKRLGFRIVGTLPGAFAHPTRGYVDAHVMFREL